MPFFAIVGLDHPPHSMALRDKVRPEHRAYVKGNDQDMRLAAVLKDPSGNQCGTLFIFEANSLEQVKAWAAKEPFCASGVYKTLTVAEVVTAYNKIPQIGWPV